MLAVGDLALVREQGLVLATITGSGSRIAAASRPFMSAGFDSATTFRPGIAIAQFSTL